MPKINKFDFNPKKFLDFYSKLHYNNKHKEERNRERNINMSIKYTEAYRKELIETLRQASKIENPTEEEQKLYAFVIDLWSIIRCQEINPEKVVELVSTEESKSDVDAILRQSTVLSNAIYEDEE